MKTPPPINFKAWIAEHRHLLKPPVGNANVWDGGDFMVTVVGGPNTRVDYHIEDGPEFFYQLEGDITVKILEGGAPVDVQIREGEIFLLPARVPHSPRRPPGTIGLVIERKRLPHELDTLLWLCPKCGAKVYQESFHLSDLTTQLQPVFERFYGDPKNCTCKTCGTVVERPLAPQAR